MAAADLPPGGGVIEITVEIGDITIPVTLTDETLAAIANAVTPLPTGQTWFSVESAAVYLDCAPQRVRKLVARREIAYHQEDVGHRVTFHRDDLDDYLMNRRNERRPT